MKVLILLVFLLSGCVGQIDSCDPEPHNRCAGYILCSGLYFLVDTADSYDEAWAQVQESIARNRCVGEVEVHLACHQER